jgi:hypothetical protein
MPTSLTWMSVAQEPVTFTGDGLLAAYARDERRPGPSESVTPQSSAAMRALGPRKQHLTKCSFPSSVPRPAVIAGTSSLFDFGSERLGACRRGSSITPDPAMNRRGRFSPTVTIRRRIGAMPSANSSKSPHGVGPCLETVGSNELNKPPSVADAADGNE